MHKRIFILAAIIACTINCKAQTVLTEGRVIYDVFFNTTSEAAQGTLIVTLKQGFMKRELIMKNGYTNTIIFNAKLNKTSSYSDAQGTKVAKILSATELIEANVKFENATYTNSTETKKIAGHNAVKTTVNYTDGSSNTVYYTNDYVPQLKEYNAMFSKIKGLPLQYEVANNSNKIILVATSIAIEPIGNSTFEDLKGYQILDN